MKRLFLVLLSIFVLTAAVSADASTAADFNKTTELLTVTVSGAEANDAVGILVLRPGYTLSSLDSQDKTQLLNCVFYSNDALADSNGKAVFNLNFKDSPSGKYNIYITTKYITSETSFLYVSSGDSAKVISIVKGYDNTSAGAAELLEYMQSDEFTATVPLEYSPMPKDLTAACKIVLNSKNSFETVSELIDVFNGAYSTQRVNEAEKADIKGIIDSCADFFDIDKTSFMYGLYNDNSEIQSAVNDKIYDKGFDRTDKLVQTLYDSALLANIEKMPNWTYFDEFMTKAKGYLKDVDYARYELYKDDIAKNCTGKTYSDIAAFVSAVNGYTPADSNISAGNKPSSGGGSSGGGSTVKVPVQNAVDVDTPIAGSIKYLDADKIPEYAKEGVTLLTDKGILSGDENGYFNPDNYITREEFAKIIAKISGEKANCDITKFKDVTDDTWYVPYVQTAVAKNLFKGIADDLFGIGMNITRQDMAVIIVRAADSMGVEINGTGTVNFNDSESISDYAAEAVNRLAAANIMVGNENGSFEPTAPATRAQAAKIISLIWR